MKRLTPHQVVTTLREHFAKRTLSGGPEGPSYTSGCALSVLAEGNVLAALVRHDTLPIDDIMDRNQDVRAWVGETLPLLFDLQCAQDALLRRERGEAYDGILDHLARAAGLPLERLNFRDCVDQLALEHSVVAPERPAKLPTQTVDKGETLVNIKLVR